MGAEHGVWVVTDEIYRAPSSTTMLRFSSMPVVVPELADTLRGRERIVKTTR